MSIKRRDGESYLAYAKRITNGKVDGTLDIDYVEWGNALIDKEYSSDNFRKSFYVISEMLKNIDIEVEDNFTEDDLLRELENKKIELQKEKIKFQDQRNAFNKLIRERARQEELNELIVSTINNNLPKLNYIHKEVVPTDNDLMVSLNDIHYGIWIDNAWNTYNSDVCRDMFEEYLDKIIQIQKRHNSQNCYVCANGDLISGISHKVIQLENKENVVQQLMGVSELISNFLYELSQHFDNVIFSSVAGNHSRLDKKDDSPKDERLDDLVEFYLKARLQNVKNIHINDDKLDTSIYLLNIRGKNYLNSHGDYDDSNYKVLSLVSMVDKPVYAVCLGHKHRNKSDYIQNIKLIMAGSFQSTDSYCVQKRIVGQPQQLVCVCDENGIVCSYDINFKK